MISCIDSDVNDKSMSLNGLRSFLEFDSMEITETNLFKNVEKWVEYQSRKQLHDNDEDVDIDKSEKKRNLLKSVKDLLRFGLMNSEFLQKMW